MAEPTAPTQEQAALKRAYHATFDTPHGREVLEDLLKFCGFAEDGHCPGDPFETAFRAGKRRAALRILGILGLSDVEAFRLGRRPIPLQESADVEA